MSSHFTGNIYLPPLCVCVCFIRNDLILYQKENEELLFLTFFTIFWDVMKWKYVSGYIQNVSEILPFASPDPFPALPYLLCARGTNIIVTEFGYGCTNNDQKRLFLFPFGFLPGSPLRSLTSLHKATGTVG